MTDTSEPEMNPEEGQKAIFELMQGVMSASENQDLEGLEAIIGKLSSVVDATGVDVSGFEAQQAALLQRSQNVRHHIENTEAALWVGDLKRADVLISQGPDMDLSAIGVVENDDEYEDNEDFLDDFDTELQAFLADAGLDGIDFDEVAPEEPDLYEQIALGTEGAIEEFVQSGADPNVLSGTARHSALLAALDAPGRRVEQIAALVAVGADASTLQLHGDNALSWAMGYHHLETVTADSEAALMAFLSEHGADVNHMPFGYWSVLHRAIVQGGAAQVAAILPLGADVTKCLPKGYDPQKLAKATPVMLAAPKPEVLRLLLEHGANPSKRDAARRLPLDFIEQEASMARARVNDDWTSRHAEALEQSVQIIRDQLNK